MRGDTGEVHPPAGQLEEEEDIETPQPDGLNGEEVTRQHAVRLLAEKR
jgi:hypothetical protein